MADILTPLRIKDLSQGLQKQDKANQPPEKAAEKTEKAFSFLTSVHMCSVTYVVTRGYQVQK